MDDYEQGDEWDWDRNDSSQYCQHGTFIGSWWGPDLLCGACEMGVPVALDRYWSLQRAVRQAESHSILMIARAVDVVLPTMAYSASLATYMVNMVLVKYDEIEQCQRWVRRCKARVRHYLWLHRAEIERQERQYEEENT